ncbi:hypothetical protein VPHK379_0089 [Vibrio phage K379]
MRTAILIILTLTILGLLAKGYSDCDGQYVRGLFWYECVR